MFVMKRKYLELNKRFKNLEKKYANLFITQDAKDQEIENLNNKLLDLNNLLEKTRNENLSTSTTNNISNDNTSISIKEYEKLKEKYERIIYINNGSQEMIKDPITELPPKFNFERLRGIQLEPREEEAKHYLEQIEKNITKKHMNNAQIGRAIDERMYSVKNRLEPLTNSWTRGKGYNCKELLREGLKNGQVNRELIQSINFDEELEVKDYYDVVEELGNRGIRII